MLYQLIILLGLAAFLANLMLNLKHLRIPSAKSKTPRPAPLISVMIPARNEEDKIRTCLESLQKQDYPNFEILVMDDNSEDGTYEIVSGMAAEDSRIKIFRGEPLPADWAGKPFACHQLARRANGNWLLFVDADTVHAPHMLRSTLATAMELKTSLLSGFVCQTARSLPLKIIMPVMYFIMIGWMPLWWLHRSKKPKPSIAIGQFFLFPRDEYWRIGGHEAVKSRVLDDIWMGIEITNRGGRHIAVDLSTVVSCDSYHSVAEVWNGLSKSICGVVAMSPPGILMLVVLACIFYFGPFYWLWHGFMAGYEPLLWRTVVGLQIGTMLLMRWMVDNRLREPSISVLFHPIGMLFYVSVVLYSAWKWLIHAPVTWKERSYGKEQTVE